jgi:peptide chain release factor 1
LIARPTIAAVSTIKTALISPVLLKRARSVAEEHAKLSTQNAKTYEVETAKKLGELSVVTAALAEWETAQNVTTLFSPRPAKSTDKPSPRLSTSSILSSQIQ